MDKKLYQRNWLRRKRERTVKRGNCIVCWTRRACAGIKKCRTCSLKALARQHLGNSARYRELDDILVLQQNRCAYSGRHIDIGSGASIEHVEPTSKARHRKADIRNIRWVHKEINIMKHNLSLHCFLSVCQEVLKFFGYDVSKQ